jgi:hypothetical protein
MSLSSFFPPKKQAKTVDCPGPRCSTLLGVKCEDGSFVSSRGRGPLGRITCTGGTVAILCHKPGCGTVTVLDLR